MLSAALRAQLLLATYGEPMEIHRNLNKVTLYQNEQLKAVTISSNYQHQICNLKAINDHKAVKSVSENDHQMIIKSNSFGPMCLSCTCFMYLQRASREKEKSMIKQFRFNVI